MNASRDGEAQEFTKLLPLFEKKEGFYLPWKWKKKAWKYDTIKDLKLQLELRRSKYQQLFQTGVLSTGRGAPARLDVLEKPEQSCSTVRKKWPASARAGSCGAALVHPCCATHRPVGAGSWELRCLALSSGCELSPPLPAGITQLLPPCPEHWRPFVPPSSPRDNKTRF